jgi:hypothetical protein
MTTTINADSSNGFKVTADTSSILALQTNGTTAISIDASQAVSFTNSPTVTGGTANGVAYLNGSKVLTTGSALVFDGTNLGLGVTPVVNASYKGIQLTDLTSTGIYGSGYGTNITTNAYLTGVTTYTRGGNSYRPSKFSSFDGAFTWSTAAAAGTTITWTDAMTLDASGNFGIGTTAPQNRLQVVTTTRPQFSVSYNGTTGLYLEDATVSSWKSWKLSTSFGAGSDLSFVQSTNTSGTPTWAATAAMTLDASGNLLVGTAGLGTIGSTSGTTMYSSGEIASAAVGDSVFSRRSTDGAVITFRRDTTSVGSINVTTTATSYVTSSDYRLKNTIAPMTGALAKVAALKPVTYKWNVDGSDGEGFIAHELQAVVPDCVTGDKDAVDEDGNPKYQGIDTSFLVATLTAAIQEQQALITQLQADVALLKGA